MVILSSKDEPVRLSWVTVAALKSPIREPLLSATVQGPPSILYSVLSSFGLVIALLKPGRSLISWTVSALLYKRTSSISPLKYLLRPSFPILKSSKEPVLIVLDKTWLYPSNWPSTYSSIWEISVDPSGSTAQTWCHWLSLKSVDPQIRPLFISNLIEPAIPLSSCTLKDDFWPVKSLPQYVIAPVVEVLIHAAMVLGLEPEIPL